MKDNLRIQTISIRQDQFEFLQEHRKNHYFIFSKFIREKLDEYMKFVEGLEIENETTDE